MRLLLLFLAACGRYGFGDLADAPGSDAQTGTRLEQQWVVYDGTLRQPASTLYDTLLATACTATATVDGTRCLPYGGYVYYADAACTQPIAQPSTPGARFAFPDSYGPIATGYAFGASVGAPAMVYVSEFSGACQGQMWTGGELFSLTDIGLAMFAKLTLMTGNEGRLVSQTFVADDGFRTPGPLHDTLGNADCTGVVYDDGGGCFPYPTDFSVTYDDNTCTHSVENAITRVSFAMVEKGGTLCKMTDFDLRPVTVELPRTMSIWVDIPGSATCAQSTVPTGWRLFDLGSPLALAPVTRAPTGSGRMQRITSTGNGASAIDTFDVWDSQLSIECQPQVAADGVSRCLPSAPYAQSAGYFSDAGCTQPIVGSGVRSCASSPVTLLRDINASSNPRVFKAVLHAGQIYGGTPTNCQPYQNQMFYTEGTELTPDMFAVVTQPTDP
ncbi:MAG: hypothetical protein JO257_38110 [Deltaproteobacteria bacterium]|nr:hypothetical protein [Deltaproteobacteria bacterium]